MVLLLSARVVSRSSNYFTLPHKHSYWDAVAYEPYPEAAQEHQGRQERPAVVLFLTTGGVQFRVNVVSGES